MNIVLLEPEIPANTGNIGRTCVATGTALHLIRPLGFLLREKELKRAGMDYWHLIDLHLYDDWQDFLQKNPGARLVMASTKGRSIYSDFQYNKGDYLVFGKESAGIPEEILKEHPDTTVRIPMLSDIRSLNLSNSAAIVLYEALRQTGFTGLQTQGELHRLKW
ncbi:MAG: tRNA (cytidine(34)-2'-O)-methyltransferase [Lachnospiraceae bacterium]|nr:tRNA (cytidine(34)-2'-O)-methyltransferase [Lachnospiraceae bacterium]